MQLIALEYRVWNLWEKMVVIYKEFILWLVKNFREKGLMQYSLESTQRKIHGELSAEKWGVSQSGEDWGRGAGERLFSEVLALRHRGLSWSSRTMILKAEYGGTLEFQCWGGGLNIPTWVLGQWHTCFKKEGSSWGITQRVILQLTHTHTDVCLHAHIHRRRAGEATTDVMDFANKAQMWEAAPVKWV